MDSDIVYPVVLLAKDGVWVARDSEELTTTQRLLLRAGLYDDQLLVDSVGRRRHLKGARELGARVGFLGRWREFWRPSGLKTSKTYDAVLHLVRECTTIPPELR
jgi:hypothetical protein